MSEFSFRRFLTLLGYALVVAFLAGAILSPPDPFTQLFYVGAFMAVAVPLVFVYTWVEG